MVVKIAIIKIGFIGLTTLIEAILDERAARKDIEIRSISSGSKLDLESANSLSDIYDSYPADFYILITPNATLPGPKSLALDLSKRKPTMLISDSPGKKLIDELNDNIGCIIVESDPLIAVRKDFLDPVEMTNFNSDVLKVLAITGTIRGVNKILDDVINQISKEVQNIKLPKIVLDRFESIKNSGLTNPYAKSKALASFELAKRAAQISSQANYKEQDREKYLLLCGTSHELMRTAAHLADEAREIEKTNDTVYRSTHLADGSTVNKTKLFDPSK